MRLVASGLSDIDIAVQLATSTDAVSAILNRMSLRYSINTRKDLIMKATAILDAHMATSLAKDNQALVTLLDERIRANLGIYHDELFASVLNDAGDLYIVIDESGTIK